MTRTWTLNQVPIERDMTFKLQIPNPIKRQRSHPLDDQILFYPWPTKNRIKLISKKIQNSRQSQPSSSEEISGRRRQPQ